MRGCLSPALSPGFDALCHLNSLFMHHFSPDELAGLLHAAAQIATRGLVMSDLVRGWLPLFFFRLAAPALARNAG